MQINNITPINKKYIYNTQTQQAVKNSSSMSSYPEAANFAKLPSTQDFLSFTGGYSLNLAETVKNLDKLAQTTSGVYPKNIREWAGMILETGNKANETLINIHKKYYENLKKCPTLSDVREKFPEFSEVLSDTEVSFSKNSFGAAVKAGELECFDPNEDLSLQILKLYYGEGFSLNDLKNYTGGTDIYHTMKKLQIPRQNRTYGYILKLSDPEYNERLTAEMTYKRRLALDKKAQELGEPVYIPRGPLSLEHREHISEGLKKSFRENPTRIFEMSERMKEFYRQNPEKSEELSRVLKRAWNIFGADRIKAALSKFMKGKGFKSFDPEGNPVDIPKEQSRAMRQFWNANEWARKSFSKYMEFAWKKIKQENETFFSMRTAPSQLSRFLEEKAGLPKGTIILDTVFNPYTGKSSIDEFSQEIAIRLGNVEGLNDVLADTYQMSVLKIIGELKDMNLKKLPKKYKEFLDFAMYTAQKNLPNETNKSYKVQTTEEARMDFVHLAAFAAESRIPELVDMVNKSVDGCFDLACALHKNFILK